MKKNIHPTYHANATITCACGAVFTVGSIDQDIHVEICSACHPFYTGKSKLVDTAGRVDKFKARMEASKKLKEEAAKKQAAKATKTKKENEKPAVDSEKKAENTDKK